MASAKEFREYANECLDWARTAKTDRERSIFLQMARTWTEVAINTETRQSQSLQPRTDKRQSVNTERLKAWMRAATATFKN
jgi:hypothetical protein